MSDICPYIHLNEYRKRVKNCDVKSAPPKPLSPTISVEKLIACGYKKNISHDVNNIFSCLRRRIKIYFWTAL